MTNSTDLLLSALLVVAIVIVPEIVKQERGFQLQLASIALFFFTASVGTLLAGLGLVNYKVTADIAASGFLFGGTACLMSLSYVDHGFQVPGLPVESMIGAKIQSLAMRFSRKPAPVENEDTESD